MKQHREMLGAVPLQQRPVVESEPRRVLGDVDIDGRAGEGGGDNERQMSGQHGVRLPCRKPHDHLAGRRESSEGPGMSKSHCKYSFYPA